MPIHTHTHTLSHRSLRHVGQLASDVAATLIERHLADISAQDRKLIVDKAGVFPQHLIQVVSQIR
jgi:2'-5' RNA ligase